MSFAATLLRRGAQAAARAERQVARAIAEFATDEIEGVRAEPVAGGVRLSGSELRARAESDARLRWLAVLWRRR